MYVCACMCVCVCVCVCERVYVVCVIVYVCVCVSGNEGRFFNMHMLLAKKYWLNLYLLSSSCIERLQYRTVRTLSFYDNQ